MSVNGNFLNQENIIKKVFDESTNSLRIIGSFSIPAPAGGATEAKQDVGNTSLNGINSKIPSNLTVIANRLQVELPSGSGGLTNTELRASPVAVSATALDVRGLTFAGDKVDVTGSSLVVSNFPSGLATLSEQQAHTSTLASISQKVVLVTKQVSTLLDTSVTNITSTPVTIFTSLTNNAYSFQTVEDIGEFMALCTGSPGSETVVAALPLGGGEVNVFVSAGTRVSVKTLNNNIIAGKLIINSLGIN